MITEGLISGQIISGATPTVALSPTALTNGGLLVQVGFFKNNNTIECSGITWNGDNMTSEGVIDNDYIATLRRLSVHTFSLIAPTADGTSRNLAITFNEAPTSAAVSWWFLNGLDQTDFASNLVTNVETGTANDTPTVNITSVNNNAWLVGSAVLVGGGSGGNYWTPTSPNTEKADLASGTSTTTDIRFTTLYQEQASTGTYTLESQANSANRWTIAGIELKPAAASSTDPDRERGTMRGVTRGVIRGI